MRQSALTTGVFILLLAFGGIPGDVSAQHNEEEPRSPLAIQQEGLSDKMANLQQKLLRLVQQIREDNPSQADTLLEALKKAKQQKVQKRMDEISRLLDDINYDQAASQQQKIIRDVRAIIKTLTERDDYYERLKKRIEKLEQWRDEVNQLSRQEWTQKRESKKLSDLEKVKENVAKNIDKVRELLKKQNDIKKQTQSSRETGEQKFGELAESQEQLRKSTQKLSQNMTGKQSQSAKTSQKTRSPEPGQKQLQKAAEHQKESTTQLSEGKGLSAEKTQTKSIQSLQEALSHLQKEQKRLESMSPQEQMKRMSDKQSQIKDQTESLKNSMGGSEMKSTRQSLNSAQGKMSKASQKLSKKNPKSAAGQQKEAHDDLQKARDKIDKQLSEMRKQQRDALLSKLIEMFKTMLKKQQSITETTENLNQTREKGEWDRSESIRCAEMAQGEFTLHQKAGEALNLLTENGSPVVFPQVVRSLSKDLMTARKLLQGEKTGDPTQRIQTDIEQTLEDFIGALKNAKDNPPPQENKGKKSQSKAQKQPPLINVLAELKLLKNMQKRVNSRTRTLAQEKQNSPSRVQQIDPLSQRQNSILHMTEDLREKLEGASNSSLSSEEK